MISIDEYDTTAMDNTASKLRYFISVIKNYIFGTSYNLE